MTNSSLTSTPEPLADFSRLISDVVARRAEFTDLIAALTPMLSREHPPTPEVALQLSTALHEIEQTALYEDQLHVLVDDIATPALALSESGRILVMNAGAAQLFALQSGASIRSLGITRDDFQRFKERLAEVSGPTMLRVSVEDATDKILPLVMIGSYHYRLRAYVLFALQHHWPESIDHALHDVFGLSVSEREVLAFLAQGLSSEQIADRRARAIGTIRQQIKTILRKLGSPTQLQAATMAAAAAAAAGKNTSPAAVAPSPGNDQPMFMGEFVLDTRRVAWRRFGASEGRPVLMLHGPSFGAGEFPADRLHACANGLDVYALERSGYGRTHPPESGEDVLQSQCADALALMTREGLERVTILAHEVGIIPALALARQHPQRVQAVLAVSSAPPFRQLEQINAMPAQQAIFIQAARHARWMARLMIRLLTVRVRRLGPEQWYKVVFADDQREMRIVSHPELRSGVIGTYSFNHDQQGSGYEHDLQIMLNDWGALVSDCPVPLHLLHGDSNATTPLRYLDIFRSLKDNIAIDVVADEGLTLAVSQPARIWRTLARLAQDG